MEDEKKPLLPFDSGEYGEFVNGSSQHKTHSCESTHNADVCVVEDGSPNSPGHNAKKQGSVVTIFSIWNTMMGSSLLCMPWALGEAGFILGIFFLVTMAIITCYTAYRVIKSVDGIVRKNDDVFEFSDVCSYYFGNWGLYISVVFSVSSLLGAAMAYWVLMSNFMYHTVTYAYEESNHLNMSPTANVTDGVECPHFANEINPTIPTNNNHYSVDNSTDSNTVFFQVWDKTLTVPLLLVVLMFPLVNFKSPTFFTKFNSLGTISVLYILVFVTIKSIGWGIHIDFDGTNPISSVPFTSLTFPALTGLLSLSYFLHNGMLSIMHNQRNPENNGRDLCISYFLVAMTYTWIGVIFYATFPLQKDCIESNLLDNFASGDIMAVVARLLMLFQLITIYPLLLYIMRVQLMNTIFGKSWPGLKYILALNVTVVGLCVLCAMYLPHIGTIIRFTGAFSGLAYIFTLPCLVYMVYLWRGGRLTWVKFCIHAFIIALGVVNFIGQFIIIKVG